MKIISNSLKAIFLRDLQRLIDEINQYQNEDDLWKVEGKINNSAGNLCLHLIGNLNTYIGKELGGTDYKRNRDLEFSLKGVPRIELIQKIEDTISVITETFDTLDDDVFESEYPILVFEEKTSTAYFLIHLTTHLAYHLGQINYHRRLIEVDVY